MLSWYALLPCCYNGSFQDLVRGHTSALLHVMQTLSIEEDAGTITATWTFTARETEDTVAPVR